MLLVILRLAGCHADDLMHGPPAPASTITLGEIVIILRVRIWPHSLEKCPVAYRSQDQIGARRVCSHGSETRA